MGDQDKQLLDLFFREMADHYACFHLWTTYLPQRLVINPELIGKLSRMEGFYQRKELESLVPAHAPVVRHIRMPYNVVLIEEDLDEPFYHFEG